jgi:transcriptional regulator of heat shock response
MKKLSIIILLLFSISNAFSQPTIPNISKTKFQIGDQVVYSFSLPLEKASELSTYILTEKKDSLEIIKQTIDTTKKNGKEFLDVKFYFTSFVEGKHKIINQNGRSFEYEVTSYPIDTTSFEIKDIKANVKEPFTIKEIMPIIIWVLIAIILIILSYFL